MIPPDYDEKIRRVIASFPEPHRSEILKRWTEWAMTTDAEPPYHVAWSEFASQLDDPNVLYSERRVYLRRVTNELRDLEVPKTRWQKVARALAAVASFFLIVFLALSRLARGAE